LSEEVKSKTYPVEITNKKIEFPKRRTIHEQFFLLKNLLIQMLSKKVDKFFTLLIYITSRKYLYPKQKMEMYLQYTFIRITLPMWK